MIMDRLKDKNRWKMLLAVLAFGSLWGLAECVLGSLDLGGVLSYFPMGALLGGLVGLGLMAYTRKTFRQPGMQLAMGGLAAVLRFWSPVGTCILCSALAIMFEAVVFEMIFNWKIFDVTRSGDRSGMRLAMLVPLGVLAGYTIYVSGYMFTQIFTPVITTGVFTLSDFLSALPLILGRGFFAAVLGGVALPLGVYLRVPGTDIYKVAEKPLYVTLSVMALVCWVLVISLSRYGFFG